MYHCFVVDVRHAAPKNLKMRLTTSLSTRSTHPEVRAEEDRREDDHERRGVDLLARGPGDALQLVAHLTAGTPAGRRTTPSRLRPHVRALLSRCRAWLTLTSHPAGAPRRRARPGQSGRPRGTRTPNPRFWRPVLYQLSYWPSIGAWGVGRGAWEPRPMPHGPCPMSQLLRLPMRLVRPAPRDRISSSRGARSSSSCSSSSCSSGACIRCRPA